MQGIPLGLMHAAFSGALLVPVRVAAGDGREVMEVGRMRLRWNEDRVGDGRKGRMGRGEEERVEGG